METVGSLPARAAAKWGGKTFATTSDSSMTFTTLAHRAEVIGSRLLAAGIQPGERVMILLPNRLEAFEVVAGSWRVAAVPVPVVAIYRTHELRYIVQDMEPAAVITQAVLGDRELGKELNVCFSETGVSPRVKWLLDIDEPADGWEPFPAEDASVLPHGEWPDFESDLVECLRLYTSGTTSNPKGAMLNSRTVIGSASQPKDTIGIGESDVGVALAPVTHLAGLLSAFLVPLATGSSATVLPKWNVNDAIDLVDRFHGTFAYGAAVFLKDLVEAYESGAGEGKHILSVFLSGGSSTAPSLIERADALGIKAIRTYGSTETAGSVTVSSPRAPLERRANWDGQLTGGVEVQVIDDDGNPVPPGTEGILRLRGDRVMLGFSAPSANVDTWVDGWFYPGDVGSLTEDGWLKITGRTKDIINRGGEKFSAADIEGVIQRHPAIGNAAVIGIPDERLGESVGAYVVLRPGFERPKDEELAAFLIDAQMAKAKIPTSWFFIDALPASASGKIQKHLLRKNHLALH